MSPPPLSLNPNSGIFSDESGRRTVSGLVGGAVFGPVSSRRYGWSLGVNLLPASKKICTFDCPYCECGYTPMGCLARSRVGDWAQVEGILEDVVDIFETESLYGRRVDAITLAGNGEPTLHPDFLSLMKGLSGLCRVLDPSPRLVVLTNGARLDRESVREGLKLASEAAFKLDAGNARMQALMNRPIERFDFEKWINRVVRFPNPVLQSMFVRGRVDNSVEKEVDTWLDRIREIGPDRVDLYSLDRSAPDRNLERVPRDRLNGIADRVRCETGIPVSVY